MLLFFFLYLIILILHSRTEDLLWYGTTLWSAGMIALPYRLLQLMHTFQTPENIGIEVWITLSIPFWIAPFFWIGGILKKN